MFLGCFQDVKELDANIGVFLELSLLSQIFFGSQERIRTCKIIVGMAGFEPASSPAPKAGGVTGLPNIPASPHPEIPGE